MPHAVKRAYVAWERAADDGYYIGRYRAPDGQWLETEHGFDDAGDALDEARELEQAARRAASTDT